MHQTGRAALHVAAALTHTWVCREISIEESASGSGNESGREYGKACESECVSD
jgi:hypothetical protein